MKTLFKITTFLVIAQSVLYLSGCSLFKTQDTFAKDQLQAQEFYLQNPGELAKVCAQKFPVSQIALDTGHWITSVDSSVHFSTLIPGGTLQVIPPGQLIINGEPAHDTVIMRVDTVYRDKIKNFVHQRTDTLRIKDNAAVDSMKNFVARQTDQVSKLQQQHIDDDKVLTAAGDKATTRLWICIGLGVLCLILLIVLIEKIL